MNKSLMFTSPDLRKVGYFCTPAYGERYLAAEAAVRLPSACALKGAHVIMLNRKSERSVAAAENVSSAAPGALVTPLECDLMSFESVRACVAQVQAKVGGGGVRPRMRTLVRHSPRFVAQCVFGVSGLGIVT